MLKIEFTCHKCSETFRVSLGNLIERTVVTCPDCNERFYPSTLDELRKLAFQLQQVEQAFERESSNDHAKVHLPNNKRWSFRLVDTKF